MKKFLKIVLASAVGCFIVVICTFVPPIVFINKVVFKLENFGAIHSASVLKIDLSRVLFEKSESRPLMNLLFQREGEPEGLNQVLLAIKQAKKNEKIVGIYLKAGETKFGYATAEAIRKALIDFKKSKKFLLSYGENFNQPSYYIASISDKIYMNPLGMFDFRGLAVSAQFNKRALKKWGIEMQVYRVGKYKSAVEPFMQKKMSNASKEQIMDLLSNVWLRWIQGISKSRKISVAKLNWYANQCLTFTCPDSIVSYKLIDGLKYEDEVETLLKKKSGVKNNGRIYLISTKELASVPKQKNHSTKNKIAVLYAEGEIVSDMNVSFCYDEPFISAEKYIRILNELKEDSSIKAVVFRINSPGGSAYASEQIWHAVRKLQEIKPIVVSMGDYAASGGYYIACGANTIVAEFTTLTGSIGIFGLVPNGLQLAKKIGVTHDHVSLHRHSNLYGDMLSVPLLSGGCLDLLPARPLSNEESAMMQSSIKRSYSLFLSRVSESRGKTKKQIHVIAQGRVWTGKEAISLGLIDQLGGVDVALRTAAKLSKIKNYLIEEYPKEKNFLAALFDEVSVKVSEKITEQLIGKDLYEQRKKLFLWEKYDYRQALMPYWD